MVESLRENIHLNYKCYLVNKMNDLFCHKLYLQLDTSLGWKLSQLSLCNLKRYILRNKQKKPVILRLFLKLQNALDSHINDFRGTSSALLD